MNIHEERSIFSKEKEESHFCFLIWKRGHGARALAESSRFIHKYAAKS